MTMNEIINKYRHDCNRKSTTIEEVDDTVIVVPKQDAEVMGIYKAESLGLTAEDPFGDLPDRLANQMVFILEVDGVLYLINTEGYSYCRYVAKCEIS